MSDQRVTRGFGLLERHLAVRRARLADRLIPSHLRSGRLLDIGCGTYPYFLTTTQFKEKVGLEQDIPGVIRDGTITLHACDLHRVQKLPFENAFFDVVTMLAVLEHIELPILPRILSEIHRILKPGGLYLLTTPAPWTATLLRTMAKLRLVSPDEINDHKDVYSHAKIVSVLTHADFKKSNIQCGYFELGMNIWAAARKEETNT